MRACFRACVVVFVASCGPGGTTGGGGTGSASGGAHPESSAASGGGEATSGGDDSDGNESDDGGATSGAEGESDGGGSEAHECTPFDPALDEPACTAAGDAEAEPNDQVSQANVVCVDRDYVATISNDADIDVF